MRTFSSTNKQRAILSPLAMALSPLALTIGLTGCGDDEQDRTPSASAEPRPVSGLVIDGYMARSRVYLDLDGNGMQDPWEPAALTDDEGYFSTNPRRELDYCAEPDSLHCLRVRPGQTGNLRAAGGYDELTGEPATAELSAALPPAGDALLTPFTTLLAEAGLKPAEVLLQLGLTEADLSVDYLATGDAELSGRAISLHKVISVLNAELQTHFPSLGEEVKLPASASGALYRALGQALRDSASSLPELLADGERLRQVSQSAQGELRQRHASTDISPPAPMESRAAALGGELVALADTLFSAPAVDTRAAARALEVVVQQAALRGADSARTTARFLREGPAETVAALLEGLGSDRADLPALARLDFSTVSFVDAESARASAQLPANAEPFMNLAGRSLRVQDLDLGQAPHALRDVEMEAYFSAGETSTAGGFTACVKYIEEASSGGSLGEGNTRGERVQGHWQLLKPDAGVSYNLLLSIRFLGTDYQAIMKPAGETVVDGASYQLIRFDYAGDIRTWHSPGGLQATVSVPADNAACRARLPSRVGL